MRTKKVFVGTIALAILLTAAVGAAAKSHPPEINPGDFVAVVDNPFFPLVPGTTFFYEGETDGVPSSNVTYVTHTTKQILGVNCIEVHDQGFEDGVLTEDTLDWYAQDTSGNVWYFGEDTKELDPNGDVISTEGSWEAGVNGASPGIIMEADPKKGDRYQQEFAVDVAEDMAQVRDLDASTCTPYTGCLDDLLQTKEWSPLEKRFVEDKYYAEDVGFIRSTVIKGGDEITELVNITTE
jgi:hypothetical protein